mmetsp:Transcript_21472/g.47738  ORF Transcript_21472/g.47738 Transcript_21472/m.47738 type:complete len:478 (+) Transcript_21472:48-1481(+)
MLWNCTQRFTTRYQEGRGWSPALARCGDATASLPGELVELVLHLLQVDLHLLALVEDGAVAVRANDLLVEGALAALALGPQLVEHALVQVHLGQLGRVDLALLAAAVPAQRRAGHLVLRRYQGAAAHAGLLLHREGHDAAPLGRGLADGARVVTADERLRVGDDGLEDAHERVGELVGEVVLRVDGQVVVQHPHRVLALLVCGRALGRLDDNVGHAVAHVRRGAGVSLAHAHGQLHVRLLVRVVRVVRRLAQRLGDDEHADVHLVLQQVADRALGVVDGALHVAVDDDLAQTGVHHLAHQQAVVASHGLQPLGVQLVVLVGPGPQQARVSLLIHEQVGEVHLLELQLNGVGEDRRHLCGRLLRHGHSLSHGGGAELDHHRVRVSVDHLGVVLVAVLDRVLALHETARGQEQVAAVGGHGGGDGKAGQLAHGGSGEAVHGVGGDLEGHLPTILHSLHHRVRRGRHVFLRALAGSQQLV